MPPKLIFDDEALKQAVRDSTSYWQIARKLRPNNPRGIYKSAQRRIQELALDTSHFTGQGPRRTRWTNEQLANAVKQALSVASVIRMLGLVPAGGNYNQVQRRIRELELDTSHFTGQGWNTGGKFVPTPALPFEQVLVRDRWTTSHVLKWRLIKAGLKEAKCEMCGWCERAPDGRIPIELDHVNGDKNDNRLENLRILCPNCHSLQPTHRGLNKRTRRGEPNHAQERAFIVWSKRPFLAA